MNGREASEAQLIRETAQRALEQQAIEAERCKPTLPKPCGCEEKDCIPAHDEDGTAYCFKCTGGLPA